MNLQIYSGCLVCTIENLTPFAFEVKLSVWFVAVLPNRLFGEFEDVIVFIFLFFLASRGAMSIKLLVS
jgi:hypothetical protein